MQMVEKLCEDDVAGPAMIRQADELGLTPLGHAVSWHYLACVRPMLGCLLCAPGRLRTASAEASQCTFLTDCLMLCAALRASPGHARRHWLAQLLSPPRLTRVVTTVE